MFGAYHFARPAGKSLAGVTASAIKQANHFLAVAGPQPGELPPVLDLEKTGNLSKQRLLAWTLAWLGQIDARTGVEPFLYTSPLFWKGNLGDSTAAAAAGTRPLDRALDAEEQAAGSRAELERQRLEVLAVDELRLGAGGQALHRRRPAERGEARVRSRSNRSRAGCLSSPPRRRSSGLLQQGSCSRQCPACGRAASRSPSRISGDGATRQVPTALRSPARPPRRTDRSATTSDTRSRSS